MEYFHSLFGAFKIGTNSLKVKSTKKFVSLYILRETKKTFNEEKDPIFDKNGVETRNYITYLNHLDNQFQNRNFQIKEVRQRFTWKTNLLIQFAYL